IANPLFKPQLALSALPILLQPRLTLPGETPLYGLHEIPPAHIGSFSKSGLSIKRYWKLSSAPHQKSFTETAQHIRELMEDIVSRQMTPDIPFGAMLSGGVDSTSVAALAMKNCKNTSNKILGTYCVQFETDSDYFESTELRPEIDAPYAKMAAEHLGST